MIQRWSIRCALVLAVGLLAVISCGEESSPTPSAPPATATAPGAEASRPTALPEPADQYGRLPDTVAGWRVSRGAAAGYVADAACAQCHAEEHAKFQTSGMSTSFYRPDPKQIIEDLSQPFFHELTGFHYEMSVRDGKYRVKRYCKDAHDEPFAELEVEVAWVMGVGKPTRAYIAQNEAGELYQIPLCWYDDSGWGMAPGYDRKDHHRFERALNRTCIFCHGAYPETPVGSDLPHKPDVFPHTMPDGIGCQRCHGPGARHVEWASDPGVVAAKAVGQALAPGAARILNPADFTVQQRDDLCLSCHLETEAHHTNTLIRAFDRPVYSWLPGKDLTRFVIHLDHGTEPERRARVQAGGQAYRLRLSRCYTASGGELTCLSCHESHGKVAKAQQPAYYRAKCLQCHELEDCEMPEMGKARDPANSDCVACHMFEARPADIVHVVIRDHLIRRSPPAKDLTAPRREIAAAPRPLEIVPFYPNRSGKDPRWEVYAGFGSSFVPSAATLQKWVAAFQRTKPHVEAAYVNVGRGLIERGGHAQAIEILSEGVEQFPEAAEMRWSFGQALLSSGQLAAAVAQLELALELDPDSPGINGSLAQARAKNGEHKQALPLFRRSLQLRSGSWATWQQYAYTLLQTDDLEAALTAFRRAIAWNPDDAYSYRMASWIHRKKGRSKAALRILEQGGSRLLESKLDLVVALLVPEDPRVCDTPRALALATEAVRDHPDEPRSHLHLALALLLAGDTAPVMPEIGIALDRGADSACVNALMAIYWLRSGNRDKAEQCAEWFRRDLSIPGPERLRPVLLELVRAWIRPVPKKK